MQYPHAQKRARELRETGDKADIVFVVGGGFKFKAHTLIVQQYSDFVNGPVRRTMEAAASRSGGELVLPKRRKLEEVPSNSKGMQAEGNSEGLGSPVGMYSGTAGAADREEGGGGDGMQVRDGSGGRGGAGLDKVDLNEAVDIGGGGGAEVPVTMGHGRGSDSGLHEVDLRELPEGIFQLVLDFCYRLWDPNATDALSVENVVGVCRAASLLQIPDLIATVRYFFTCKVYSSLESCRDVLINRFRWIERGWPLNKHAEDYDLIIGCEQVTVEGIIDGIINGIPGLRVADFCRRIALYVGPLPEPMAQRILDRLVENGRLSLVRLFNNEPAAIRNWWACISEALHADGLMSFQTLQRLLLSAFVPIIVTAATDSATLGTVNTVGSIGIADEGAPLPAPTGECLLEFWILGRSSEASGHITAPLLPSLAARLEDIDAEQDGFRLDASEVNALLDWRKRRLAGSLHLGDHPSTSLAKQADVDADVAGLPHADADAEVARLAAWAHKYVRSLLKHWHDDLVVESSVKGAAQNSAEDIIATLRHFPAKSQDDLLNAVALWVKIADHRPDLAAAIPDMMALVDFDKVSLKGLREALPELEAEGGVQDGQQTWERRSPLVQRAMFRLAYLKLCDAEKRAQVAEERQRDAEQRVQVGGERQRDIEQRLAAVEQRLARSLQAEVVIAGVGPNIASISQGGTRKVLSKAFGLAGNVWRVVLRLQQTAYGRQVAKLELRMEEAKNKAVRMKNLHFTMVNHKNVNDSLKSKSTDTLIRRNMVTVCNIAKGFDCFGTDQGFCINDSITVRVEVDRVRPVVKSS